MTQHKFDDYGYIKSMKMKETEDVLKCYSSGDSEDCFIVTTNSQIKLWVEVNEFVFP